MEFGYERCLIKQELEPVETLLLVELDKLEERNCFQNCCLCPIGQKLQNLLFQHLRQQHVDGMYAIQKFRMFICYISIFIQTC